MFMEAQYLLVLVNSTLFHLMNTFIQRMYNILNIILISYLEFYKISYFVKYVCKKDYVMAISEYYSN